MAPKDKRHQEITNKIRKIMKNVGDEVLVEGVMPSLEIPKVGYDNTVWSDEKGCLLLVRRLFKLVQTAQRRYQPLLNI